MTSAADMDRCTRLQDLAEELEFRVTADGELIRLNNDSESTYLGTVEECIAWLSGWHALASRKPATKALFAEDG